MFHSPTALAQMDALVGTAADERVTLYRPGAPSYDDYGAETPGTPVVVGVVRAQVTPESATERVEADRLAGQSACTVRLATADLPLYPVSDWTAVWESDHGSVALSVEGVVPETVPTGSRWADLLCTANETAGVPA